MLEKRKRISKDEVSTNHLNKDFILSHQALWDKAKISYEFLDKKVIFSDAVCNTKDLLDSNITKLRKKNYFM